MIKHKSFFGLVDPVDGVRLAEDEPSPLPHISVGFHIGCGANLVPDTFFSGPIDDVRICNRAVRP